VKTYHRTGDEKGSPEKAGVNGWGEGERGEKFSGGKQLEGKSIKQETRVKGKECGGGAERGKSVKNGAEAAEKGEALKVL